MLDYFSQIFPTIFLSACFYHVAYTFQSEFTLYICLNVKVLLSRNRCHIWSLSDYNGTRTHNHLVCKRKVNHLAKQSNDWAVLWVLICTVHLTICFYHATFAFQSEFTLYICLNVKELLAQNRRHIWSLSDCNETRTHNHLVCKWTLNHLAKLSND